MRVPGQPNRFLINPFGLAYDEVTASNLLKIDEHGRLTAPSEHPINLAGFIIHSAIHQARHDAVCVVHTHTVADNAVSALDVGLLPLTQTSAVFFEAVATHPYEGPATNMEEQARLQANIGDKPILLLRNHGMLAVGATVSEAFILTYYFQRACQMQVATMGCGAPYKTIDDDIARQNAAFFVRLRKSSPDWLAVRRRLDRLDPSYKT